MAVPNVPAYIDAVLCDTPLTGGIEPKLGRLNLRILTVLGFPNVTTPGLLDPLNDLGFAYRWVTRWIPLDATASQLTRIACADRIQRVRPNKQNGSIRRSSELDFGAFR